MGVISGDVSNAQTAHFDRWRRIARGLLLGWFETGKEAGVTRIDAFPSTRTDAKTCGYFECAPAI